VRVAEFDLGSPDWGVGLSVNHRDRDWLVFIQGEAAGQDQECRTDGRDGQSLESVVTNTRQWMHRMVPLCPYVRLLLHANRRSDEDSSHPYAEQVHPRSEAIADRTLLLCLRSRGRVWCVRVRGQ
jgi:hypothetical protein